jgi:hypothetical protein
MEDAPSILDSWGLFRSWKMDNLFSFSSPMIGLNAKVNSGSSFDYQRLPLTSSLASAFRDLPSVVCRRIQGTGEAGDELDEADDADDSGGGMAEEWQRNGGRTASKTLLSSPQEMANGCRQQYRALDTSPDSRRWRNLTILSSFLLRRWLFTFATVLARSGSDQQLINLSFCQPTLQLSLLSHHPLFAQLMAKSNTYARPLKKYDRATISDGRP